MKRTMPVLGLATLGTEPLIS